MKRKVLLHRWELLLCLIGTALLCIAGTNLLRYYAFQNLPDLPANLTSVVLFDSHAKSIQVAGKLEVPRLGFSVKIVDGDFDADDDEALSVGAVHLAGTGPLGGTGNAVIAGHRDTAFWPLRNLRVGDQVRIRSSHRYQYTVSSIRIVEPNDLSVLGPGSKPMLTLVTCYPFRYIGNAPKRFVVQASKN